MVRWIALAAALALAIGVAACGSSDSSSSGSQAAAKLPVDDSGSAPAADDAGKTLALGQRAVTSYVDYGAKSTKPTKVGVSVLKVRKGSISDLKDFNLDAKQRKTVPYYIDAKYENLGTFALTRHLMEPSVEDSGGTEYKPIQLIVLSGTFKQCPNYSDAKLKPGQSFTGCTPVLLPKGHAFGRVRFDGDVTKDPVFWGAQ
jgi:hypothetical protein